jgi:hypothetical protein
MVSTVERFLTIFLVGWLIGVSAAQEPSYTNADNFSSLRGGSGKEAQRSLEPIKIDYLGNNGKPAEAFPLPRCAGDCDDDDDVSVALIHMVV